MTKNISTFKVFSIIIQIIISYNFSSSVTYECDPEEQCKNYFKGYDVKDPNDCYSYYVCMEDVQGNTFPSDNSIKCQDGYYYIGFCTSGSTCKNECLNLCRTECTDYNFERVADVKDCSSFYLCLPGRQKAHHKCPHWKPYFDGFQCSNNKFVCCHSSEDCTPYCTDSYYQIADPYDCRSYYYCSSEGIPVDEDRYTCKEGKYFEPYIGRCEIEHPGKKCKPKCSESTVDG
ncbi:hypothetical protein Avbf_15917 [Armadillidium vulgare]|nr:hypothetical protein Avbf_15917 [Armadillidium vulgare]